MEKQLTKAEIHEIEAHQRAMSGQNGRNIAFGAAREDWLANHAEKWRLRRHADMLEMQREEIQRHKWIESEKARRDMGREAAMDWVQRYAAAWRRWYDDEYGSSKA